MDVFINWKEKYEEQRRQNEQLKISLLNAYSVLSVEGYRIKIALNAIDNVDVKENEIDYAMKRIISQSDTVWCTLCDYWNE